MLIITTTAKSANSATAHNELLWAPMAAVIGEKRMNNTLDKFKYGVRYLFSRNLRNKFLLELRKSHFGQSIFKTYPANFYVPLRSYLDNRFSVKERFEVCLKDIEAAETKFGKHYCNQLLHGGSVTLLKIDNFSVDLQMNRMSQHEGFWAITIKDKAGKPISNLTFGFLDCKTILIASIQGAKDSNRNILELNRFITKQAFGLRPQNLLVATMQSLCQAWNVENLIGIDPRNQVKRRINTAKQGFKFDYTAFWNELGATKNFSGYWTLNNKTPTKQLAEVPSNKRNQYRKRNALLELISANSLHLFQAN